MGQKTINSASIYLLIYVFTLLFRSSLEINSKEHFFFSLESHLRIRRSLKPWNSTPKSIKLVGNAIAFEFTITGKDQDGDTLKYYLKLLPRPKFGTVTLINDTGVMTYRPYNRLITGNDKVCFIIQEQTFRSYFVEDCLDIDLSNRTVRTGTQWKGGQRSAPQSMKEKLYLWHIGALSLAASFLVSILIVGMIWAFGFHRNKNPYRHAGRNDRSGKSRNKVYPKQYIFLNQRNVTHSNYSGGRAMSIIDPYLDIPYYGSKRSENWKYDNDYYQQPSMNRDNDSRNVRSLPPSRNIREIEPPPTLKE